MGAFIDARTVPSGTTVRADVAIVGGGPAGITLALALASTKLKVVLLESGGMTFDAKTQSLYEGAKTGAPYVTLEASRLRYLGGSSNHWGGWCRPMDATDFEEHAWMPHSGWPITKADLDRHFVKAHEMCEAGTLYYDGAAKITGALGQPLALGSGGIITRWFQYSKMRSSVLPTHFGERYASDLKKAPRLSVYLQANITRLKPNASGTYVRQLDVATLDGKKFKVKAKTCVLAAGGIEVARLMLASNDVVKTGIGNARGLVGRFFADHPVPRDNAVLVLFGGEPAPFYLGNQTTRGAILRAGLFPSEDFRRSREVIASSITVEGKVELDALGKAAVEATADALGVDASSASFHSLGCGMELSPDPDRRLTLTRDRDALGMPKLKLHMRIADEDFAKYRLTLKELGRQLLQSRIGMLKLNLRTRDEWYASLDWGNHHMGTTRMSADPQKGVVDANLKVHGVTNLYVASSSVYPTYGAANPTINLLALVLRLAEHLKEALR